MYRTCIQKEYAVIGFVEHSKAKSWIYYPKNIHCYISTYSTYSRLVSIDCAELCSFVIVSRTVNVVMSSHWIEKPMAIY